MDKMKKGDLEKFRKAYKPGHKGEIMISMGTCGIAAGGDAIYRIFEEELKNKGIENIKLKKTGCLGMCFCEPNLVVKLEGMPEILYGLSLIHISEPTRLGMISYAVFCLKKKK